MSFFVSIFRREPICGPTKIGNSHISHRPQWAPTGWFSADAISSCTASTRRPVRPFGNFQRAAKWIVPRPFAATKWSSARTTGGSIWYRFRTARNCGLTKSGSQSGVPQRWLKAKLWSGATTGMSIASDPRGRNEREHRNYCESGFASDAKGDDGRKLLHFELSAVLLLED